MSFLPSKASVDENAPEETTFSSADEWDRLMNLASTEQLPNIVSYVRQMISDVPQVKEKFKIIFNYLK